MEVEEENTSNPHQESTTTVSTENLLEDNNRNDIELGTEVSESNTHEEKGEELSVVVPKLDDPNPFVAVAVGETEEKEVTVQCGNSEPSGCWKSVVVESTSSLKDDKVGDVVAVKDETSTVDVADVELGRSELTNSTEVDAGECEAAVIVRDNSLDVVEENVNNSREDTDTNGSFMIQDDKDGSEGKLETVKVEEVGEALKEGGGVDVPVLPVGEIGEREEVIADIKNDDTIDTQKEGVEIVLENETITKGQADVHGVDAEAVTEGVVADEEEALGIGKAVKEEGKMEDEEIAAGVTENGEEEAMAADEEQSVDTEPETDEEKVSMETEMPESAINSSKRKRKRRAKNSKATPKLTAGRKKIDDEDVCFICFDGGDLVLCDLRTCPKAYHPSCVNRDEAFFQTKGKWNCGWHLCSTCEKKAEYMCYTCTFSLCKSCIKTKVILCVREKEKKGFCEPCMKLVMLIETNSQENKGNIDFDDKTSWEYLFKDYWLDMKEKLNLSLPELLEAKNPWKKSEEPPPAQSEGGGSGSETLETRKTRVRKSRKQKENDSSTLKNTEWASMELLEFVSHMTGGNKSYQSQFDVQALLLEYIKTNKLRDSRRKSYIICDARLESLFGKPRVGHFEMLKLLESHFLVQEDSQIEGDVVDTEGVQVDDDEGNEITKSKKRKIRKKVDREPQSNREDYAAIDTHNINMIYLKRKLVEDLLKDIETFQSKVVGTFVRIRVSGANHKNDIYRLVQVTGTTKGETYSLGKKTIDVMLEVLNLDKKETVSIDTISNQDFMEDECKRLRQSIKCGFINRLTVGDILDKAMELQPARVDDWLETEVLRLSHLRDRASDLGRKKELRECVEKLQVLKTPEERARKLAELPLIHDDPSMDPNHVSEDEADEEDKKQDTYKSSLSTRFNKRRDYPSTSTSRGPRKNYEFTRNRFVNKIEPHDENIQEQIVQQPIIPQKPNSANEDVPEKVNEAEKMWHYKDPSGKIQGPFSMAQLRKWNNNKFFPADLRIWKKNEKEDDGILLTNALEGRFEKDNFPNLPSPTPNRSSHGGNEGLQSPTPASARLVAFGGGNKEAFNISKFPSRDSPNKFSLTFDQQNGSQSSHQGAPPQLVVDQNLPVGPYGWGGGGGASHNPQPSPSSNVYNQWGNVPNMVQNPAGNFLPQPPPPPANPPPPPPPQPNVSWGLPGNQNMNWGPNVQGPQLNSQWGGHPGWVAPPQVQGWGPTQGPVPVVSTNGNPNWVGPPNPGEMNQGPFGGGPVNQGWGSPTPRQHQNYNRSGFSGQKRNRGGFHGDTRH